MILKTLNYSALIRSATTPLPCWPIQYNKPLNWIPQKDPSNGSPNCFLILRDLNKTKKKSKKYERMLKVAKENLCVVCDLLRWVHLLFWENYPINLEKHWEQGKNHNANVCIAGGKDSSQKNVDGTLWWSNCRPYSGTRCRESRRFEIVFKKAIMFGFGYWNLVK